MSVTGGFPAPGPQDREREGSYARPTPTGPIPPAQIPMLTAHKPGIVPLRPLQLGDILDGAVKSVRYNPASMVGLSLLVLGAFLVPSAALGIGATHLMADFLSRFGPEAEAFLGVPSTLVQTIFTALATAVLSGLLVHVVGQAVLGRKPDIGQTWRSTRGRLLPLLELTVLSGLFTLLSTALLIGPGVLLLVNDSIGAGVALLLLGLLGLLVVALTVSTKISMAAPAIVLEGHGVLAGLRRSFALTKGAAFWRILGITVLAGILAGIAGSLLGLPFSIIGIGLAAVTGQDSEAGQMIVTFVSHLSALLSGAITTPFVAAVTGLLYIDR
ncbi:MAG: hypothetical protein ABIP19_05840, partial [Dermatophilaceae bacterium]